MSENVEKNGTEDILRKFTRELPVPLNDHELQAYGKMLAEKCREQELAIEKRKQVVAEHANRIKVITNEIKRIADARSKGEELRPVMCGERLHGNVIEIVRLDRYEVVDTRPAGLQDLQTSIPGTGAPTIPDGFDEGPRGEQLGSLADQPVDDEEGGPLEDEPGGEMVESSAGDQVYVSDDVDEAHSEADEAIDDTPDNVVRPDFGGVPGRATGETEDEMIDRKLAERDAELASDHPVAQRDRDIAQRNKEIAEAAKAGKPKRERSAKASKGKGKRK